MALYIAVYDIHPGDRKHLERLLSREGDLRKLAGETLYIDTFGSVEALLSTPMKYDLFIIDAVDVVLHPSGSINMDVTSQIRRTGSSAPVALFYPEDINGPVNANGSFIRGFKKPVSKDTISIIVDWAISRKIERVPRIELRGDFETVYATAREIISAVVNESHIDVSLTENRSIRLFCDLAELCVLLDEHECFLELGRDSLINMDHVASCDFHSFMMDNDTSFPISFFDSFRVTEAYTQYKTKE